MGPWNTRFHRKQHRTHSILSHPAPSSNSPAPNSPSPDHIVAPSTSSNSVKTNLLNPEKRSSRSSQRVYISLKMLQSLGCLRKFWGGCWRLRGFNKLLLVTHIGFFLVGLLFSLYQFLYTHIPTTITPPSHPYWHFNSLKAGDIVM